MAKKKIEKVYEKLSNEYEIFAENDNEWEKNGLNSTDFKSLVSVMLSTMTHTKRVIRACNALYDKATTPKEILDLSDDELTELIKPVAHYNRKTKHLKEMCQQLIDNHNGEVPRTEKELLELQGVGRKCADILMNFNFGGDTIAVDTHVHRVLNRLGIVDTKTNEDTADEINRLTPKKYKKHAHEWLIQHGMNICKSRKPKCEECIVSDLCDYYEKVS
jgi:endonuclease-3